MIGVRLTGRTKDTQGRTRKPYPNICREEMPTIEPRRHYCRLGAWHDGPHMSKHHKWNPGDRAAKEIRCRRSTKK